MEPRRLYAIAVLLVVAAVTRWLVMALQAGDDAGHHLPLARSDYTLERFDLLVMNDLGDPSFQVRSPYLEKSPEDGSVALKAPVVHLFEGKHQSWEIHAQDGWIRPDGEEMLLQGQVQLDRLLPRELTVHTQNLRIFPSEDRAHSDHAVRIERPGAVLEGVGLDATLDSERIEILSEVRGRYVPQEYER